MVALQLAIMLGWLAKTGWKRGQANTRSEGDSGDAVVPVSCSRSCHDAVPFLIFPVSRPYRRTSSLSRPSSGHYRRVRLDVARCPARVSYHESCAECDNRIEILEQCPVRVPYYEPAQLRGSTGGIVSCPAALVVLLSAIALQRVGFGL